MSHTCQGPIPTWQNHQETKWIKVVTTIRAWLLLSLFFGPGAPFPALIQPATCICLRRLPGYWTKLKATNHFAGWSWFMLQICMDLFISLEGHHFRIIVQASTGLPLCRMHAGRWSSCPTFKFYQILRRNPQLLAESWRVYRQTRRTNSCRSSWHWKSLISNDIYHCVSIKN